MLKVSVVKAKDLPPQAQKAEIYCCLVAGSQRSKTKAKKGKGGSPAWKQTFSLDLEETLVLEVWLKGKPDELFGGTTISLGGLMLDGSGVWLPLQLQDKKVGGDLFVAITAVEGKKKKEKEKEKEKNAPRKESQPLSPRTGGGELPPQQGSASNRSTGGGAKEDTTSEVFPKKSFETGDKMSSSAANEIKKRTTQFLAEQTKSSSPYVTKDEQPVILDLSGCGATYLPHTVGAITELRGLSLAFNKIKKFPQLAPFSLLQLLHLDGNQLSSLPPSISIFMHLKEFTLNGNYLSSLPAEISHLTSLERLHISNNKLASLCPEIGSLQKLEDLALNGNPLTEGLPRTIGNCTSLELLDLNGCQLTSLPNEFTRMTRMLELNLATNRLRTLPATMGRMTRLVRLDLSDNKLEDLPVSMGYCEGLETLMLERNEIRNTKLMERYTIGTDHLLDFLQKRMEEYLADHPELEEAIKGYRELDMLEGRVGQQNNRRTTENSEEPPTSARIVDTTDLPLNEKLQLVKRDGSQLISEIQLGLSNLKRSVVTARSLNEALPVAQSVRALKAEIDKAKDFIPPTVKPSPPLLHQGEDKLSQVKKTVNVALLDLERTVAGLQNVLLGASDPKVVVSLVKIVKAIHQILRSVL